MKIRCGYDLSYYCPQPVAMQFLLSVHPSRERGREAMRLGMALRPQSAALARALDAAPAGEL